MTRRDEDAMDGAAPIALPTQVVSISVFRFDRALSKIWAFGQMGLARRRVRGIPGIGFHKLFGSGSGASFDPRPNFGVYAILAAWPTQKDARRQIHESPVFKAYRKHASEVGPLYLRAYQSAGRWDGVQPFAVRKLSAPPSPIAILTRATVRPGKLRAFWRSVPAISDALCDQGQARFWLGLGEVPMVHQVTLSVWPDTESMTRFAYESGFHRDAIRQAKENRWFSEDLFARFAVLDAEGLWMGRDLSTAVGLAPTGAAA